MLSYDLPPPPQASVGELYIQGVERPRGGEPFRMGKGVGGPKSYDLHRNTVLYSGRGKFMPLPLKSTILETPGSLVTDDFKMFPL